MGEYDELLEQARQRADAFRSIAKEFIPKMYKALRDEDPNTSPRDARDRIEKDCIGIWSKRTILDALPNEAKDPEKQKSGRLSQRKTNSAAVSAAPIKKKEEIIIDNEGNAVGSGTTPPLPLSTSIDDRFTPSENNNNQFQDKGDLSPFTIFVPYNDIWQYIMHLVAEDRREDKICFKGVLQKSTHKVISITIQETPQSENELT